MSGDFASCEIVLRSQDRIVPRTGSFICSTRIVETSKSTGLATSSSLAIKNLVSKCGTSVAVSVS